MRNNKTNDSRERILAAAKRNFERYGFRKSSVDDIARDANVGKGTVYNYVSSKDDLFVQTMNLEAAKLWGIAKQAMQPAQPVPEKLLAVFCSVIEQIMSDPFLSRALMREPDLMATHLHSFVLDLERTAVSWIEDQIRQGVAEGSVRTNDPRLLAYTFYKIYQVFGYASSLEEGERDPARVRSFMTDLLTRGFLGLNAGAANADESQKGGSNES
ncbi:MAG: TetR/AcrR family transcriptional regulator [Nitrospirae bacterium]|nr:TetR/AcrR family transcriptional regulator [Nitrospirota bacterium]